MAKERRKLSIIGSTEYVDVVNVKGVPAKIDTGADSSSIWASHIRVTKDGVLHFRLFGEGSPFYNGKAFKRKDFKVAVVRSTSGHEQLRYRTHLTLKLKGRRIKVLFNLSDRSNNNFPILIGRRSITSKFLVDVSRNHTTIRPKNPKTKIAQRRLMEDPYRFHRKYIKRFAGDVNNIKLKKKGELNEVSHTI